MAKHRERSTRRQFLAATGSVALLAGCTDGGSDSPKPVTLDDFETVDASRVPVPGTVTNVETGPSSVTVTVEGRTTVATQCTEPVLEQNPYLSGSGKVVSLAIGGRETEASCEEELRRRGYRVVFTVRDIRPENVLVEEETVTDSGLDLEIPYPDEQTATTTS